MIKNQKPIRILQVFAQMNRGGAETMIMNLYRKIDRTRVQFDFVVHTPDKCAFDEEIISLGGEIHRVPRYIGRNHFEYKRTWNNLFRNYPEYKVIHAHVRSTASIFLRIAKKYGLTTIAHSHSTSNGSGIIATLKNTLQKYIVIYSDYLLAASEEAGKWLFGSEVIKKDNFFILSNAIQSNEFIFNNRVREEVRKKMKLDTKTVIGHVGNFKEPKNHSFLIDVFHEYHKINPNSILMLIGEGKLETDIKDKVRTYDLLDSVMFLGSRSDVNELMQAMDIFVFPSFFEGLGVVAIEAQAAGLPVLASEYVPEEAVITNLIRFKSLEDSPKNWAKKISDMIVKKRKNMENEIIKAGYNVNETAQKLQEYYLSIIEEAE